MRIDMKFRPDVLNNMILQNTHESRGLRVSSSHNQISYYYRRLSSSASYRRLKRKLINCTWVEMIIYEGSNYYMW